MGRGALIYIDIISLSFLIYSFLFCHGYAECLGIIPLGLCFLNFQINNKNESSLYLYRN